MWTISYIYALQPYFLAQTVQSKVARRDASEKVAVARMFTVGTEGK